MAVNILELWNMDKRLARVGVFVCATGIFYFSVLKAPKITLHLNHMDKLEHMAAYALLGFFLIKARFKGLSITMVVILASLFGGVMEIIQYFHPSREASVWDELANIVGAILGSILGRRYG